MRVYQDSKTANISTTTDSKALVLWYDQTSNIEFKIKSLVDICKITEEESIDIALDSLLDGFAKITTGNYDSLIQLQEAFQKKLMTTTIE